MAVNDEGGAVVQAASRVDFFCKQVPEMSNVVVAVDVIYSSITWGCCDY